MNSQSPVIILGAGGHAKALLHALQSAGIHVLGLTDADQTKVGSKVSSAPVLGDDSVVSEYKSKAELVNGLGSVDVGSKRKAVFDKFKQGGFQFMKVVHPKAIVADDVVVGEGTQIMAGAVIQTGTHLGDNCIINTGAIVDHECIIGSHVHVATGATLAGRVTVGEGSHIGTGATVIQGIKIGKNCLIAAGAVVVRDIPDGLRVAGVPAKEMKQ